MKKILFLLLLSIATYGQIVPTGQEQDFDYGIKNTASQLDDNAAFITVQDATGVQGKSTSSVWAKKIYVDNADATKSFLSTGLIKNGLVTTNADPTKFNITDGIGIITNFDNPEIPTSTIVSFPAFTDIVSPYLNTSNITYVAITLSGGVPVVLMQDTAFDNVQRRNVIALGAVIHSNLSTINLVNNISAPTNAGTNQLHDLYEFIGALNLTGNKYTANGTNLSLDKTAGTIGKLGVNFANNWRDPNRLSIGLQTLLSFRYRTQNGTEGIDVTVLNPAVYDLANVLTAVPSNKFSIQTVTLFQTGQTRIQYGQSVYNTLAEAEAAILTRSYVVENNIAMNGIARAYIILKNTATSLQNASDTKIVEAQKFGGIVSGGAAITDSAIIAALGYTPENVANKQNSLAVDGTGTKYATVDAVNAALPTNYAKVVYVNATSPTTATIFDLNNPPVTNDDLLKNDTSNLYIGNDASTWVYNGVSYVTKLIPETSNFYLAGTNTDAGSVKNIAISRPSSIGATSFVKIGGLVSQALLANGGVLTNPISGTGTTNTIPKFTASGIIGNSNISDNGALISTSTDANINGLTVGRGGGNNINNTSLGFSSLVQVSSVSTSTAIGNSSLRTLTSGTGNTSLGFESGRFIANKTAALTISNNSVFIGNKTSPLADSQTNQTVIGYDATGLGSNSTVIGNASTVQTWLGGRLTVGSTVDDGSNAFQLTGSAALKTAPTTSASTYDILTRNTSTGVVEKVLSNTIATVVSPTFTGTPTAPTATVGTNTTQIATTAFVTASSNPLISSLEFNDTNKTVWNNGNGNFNTNTSFGSGNLGLNTTGIDNSSFGTSALSSNTIGTGNTATGYVSLAENTTGIKNSAYGNGALYWNNVGSNNISIGSDSALYTSTAAILTNPNSSIFIGNETKSLNNSGTNEIVIGYQSIGGGSDTVTLGNTSIIKTNLRGVIQQTAYTVATLPIGAQGMFAYVTDALAPTYMTTVVGGGAVVTPVFYNGTNWVAH